MASDSNWRGVAPYVLNQPAVSKWRLVKLCAMCAIVAGGVKDQLLKHIDDVIRETRLPTALVRCCNIALQELKETCQKSPLDAASATTNAVQAKEWSALPENVALRGWILLECSTVPALSLDLLNTTNLRTLASSSRKRLLLRLSAVVDAACGLATAESSLSLKPGEIDGQFIYFSVPGANKSSVTLAITDQGDMPQLSHLKFSAIPSVASDDQQRPNVPDHFAEGSSPANENLSDHGTETKNDSIPTDFESSSAGGAQSDASTVDSVLAEVLGEGSWADGTEMYGGKKDDSQEAVGSSSGDALAPQVVGDMVFRRVSALLKQDGHDVDLAGKITGMLLEGVPLETLAQFSADDSNQDFTAVYRQATSSLGLAASGSTSKSTDGTGNGMIVLPKSALLQATADAKKSEQTLAHSSAPAQASREHLKPTTVSEFINETAVSKRNGQTRSTKLQKLVVLDAPNICMYGAASLRTTIAAFLR